MPSLAFTCSGTITGFLLGADVRTENGNREEYPTIWLRNKTGIATYTHVDDSSVKLYLVHLINCGVYQFSLSTSLQFTPNQVLEIYQPWVNDSVVRFSYQDYNGQDIRETNAGVNDYTLDYKDKQIEDL